MPRVGSVLNLLRHLDPPVGDVRVPELVGLGLRHYIGAVMDETQAPLVHVPWYGQAMTFWGQTHCPETHVPQSK